MFAAGDRAGWSRPARLPSPSFDQLDATYFLILSILFILSKIDFRTMVVRNALRLCGVSI